jgi:hypothetical protein
MERAVSVLWDIMLCSLMKVNKYFGGTCHLCLQGQRLSQARIPHKAGSKQCLLCHENLNPYKNDGSLVGCCLSKHVHM